MYGIFKDLKNDRFVKKCSFPGITGHVVLDKNADREPNYWVWQPNPDLTAFHVWVDLQMVQPTGQVSA